MQHFKLPIITSWCTFPLWQTATSFYFCATNHISHINLLSLSLITSFLVWFHFLCLLVLPVDLGGWQSHPVQPDRLLETEQPSSLRWTHRQTRHHNTTHVDKQAKGHTQTNPYILQHIQQNNRPNRQWRSHTHSTHPFHVQRESGREVVLF